MRRPLAWLLLALFIVALIVLVAGPSRHLATGEDSLEVVDEPRAVPASGNEAEPVVRKKQR